jgi:hypothetical protein
MALVVVVVVGGGVVRVSHSTGGGYHPNRLTRASVESLRARMNAGMNE